MITVLLLLATIYDLKLRIIPNYISLLILLIGFLNGKIYFSGILLAIFLLIITLKYNDYKGGGDIKILGAIGLAMGFHYVFELFIISELLEICFRKILKVINKEKLQIGLPYAPFMLISSVIVNLL